MSYVIEIPHRQNLIRLRVEQPVCELSTDEALTLARQLLQAIEEVNDEDIPKEVAE